MAAAAGERRAPVGPRAGIAGAAGQASLAGMHGDPGRYRVARQRALDGQGAADGIRGSGEHGDAAAVTVPAVSQPGTGMRARRRRERLAGRPAGGRGMSHHHADGAGRQVEPAIGRHASIMPRNCTPGQASPPLRDQYLRHPYDTRGAEIRQLSEVPAARRAARSA
jgi:hypothetical protein